MTVFSSPPQAPQGSVLTQRRSYLVFYRSKCCLSFFSQGGLSRTLMELNTSAPALLLSAVIISLLLYFNSIATPGLWALTISVPPRNTGGSHSSASSAPAISLQEARPLLAGGILSRSRFSRSSSTRLRRLLIFSGRVRQPYGHDQGEIVHGIVLRLYLGDNYRS